MLLSSILILGLQTAFRQVRFAIRRTEAVEPDYRWTRLLIDLWREEFSGLYLPPQPTPEEDGDQDISEKRFELVSQADGTMELSFFTLTPAWQQEPAHARPAKVRYRLTQTEQAETLTLSRTQQPYAGQQPIGPVSETVMTHNIKKLSFSVFDQQQRQWERLFQSDQVLPQAIRVALQFALTESEISSEFTTTFFIPTRAGAKN